MTLNSAKRVSAQDIAAERAKRAAMGRRNTREKNELAGLDEPPKPIANAGAIGEEMNKKIDEYRKKLEKKNARDLKKRAASRLPRLRTLKESILVTVNSFKASGQIKKLPTNLEQLATGELYPYLPRFNWGDYNVIPPVRDQKDSPLCWAFTATQVFESGLMIQRANFAVNGASMAPDVFRVDMVELNVRSTWQCMNPDDSNGTTAGGRYEAAFNFYTMKGVSSNSVKLLLRTPVTHVMGEHFPITERLVADLSSHFAQSSNTVLVSGNDLSLTAKDRDGELPDRHCKDGARKVKIIGWDYVKQKNQWNIPHRKELKQALLEHGPIAVSLNQNGLTEYGEQKIDANCTEVGRNPQTGVVFKQDPNSGDLFVRFPRKAFDKLMKEKVYGMQIDTLAPDTYVNLNATPQQLRSIHFPQTPLNQYQVLGAVADCLQQGDHLRQAKEDRDVGTFYDKETSEFIWHFSATNDVRLKQVAGEWTLHFPTNTETKLVRNQDGVWVILPAGKEFEDLTPIFRPDPKARANHEVMLVGWDDRKQTWIVQNSWGEGWGFRCYGYREDLTPGSRGFAYIAYGTFGQFAAWLEAPLVEQKLWKSDPQ